MIKKQSVVALVLLLLIPLVLMLGGMLFKLINPEIAAGHPNYVRNFHLLSLLKNMCFFASVAGRRRVVDPRVPAGDPLQKAILPVAVSDAIAAHRVRRSGDVEGPRCDGDRHLCQVRA